MHFYIERAAKTRIGDNGQERKPSTEFRARYRRALTKLFARGPKPVSFGYDDVMSNGHLRQDIFNRCWQQIDKQSTPGYPYLDKAKNFEINVLELYMLCDNLIRLWILEPISCNQEETKDPGIRLHYFMRGHLFPAKVFIKSEPTNETKIARLIHGLSIAINVLARICFGDYLNEVKEGWAEENHKVGMDFLSEDGLKKFTHFYDNLLSYKKELETIAGRPLRIIRDDIQGYEFQARDWMMIDWHEAFLERADATDFQKFLVRTLVYLDLLQLVIDSDGFVHSYPFYIRQSGVVLTHKLNSDERSALFQADQHLDWSNYPADFENGDDCNGIQFYSGDIESSDFGFVHTDEGECTALEFGFCSQIFYRLTVRDVFQRRPDGVQKMLYNLLSIDSLGAACDILVAMAQHPLRAVFDQIFIHRFQDRVFVTQ